MTWLVEYTDEFGKWWAGLTEAAQEDIAANVTLLEEHGPNLRHPFSSGISRSKHAHMRELIVQHKGKPIRIFYAFNPLRTAILLIGGDKTGRDRFYIEMIPKADRLYDVHLEELKKEGVLK
jgi:hypothetical protein